MSLQIVACCDGTPAERDSIPLGRCRAFMPTGTIRWAQALPRLRAAGWGLHRGKLLCPACMRGTLSR
jgi:hypothetical protein